MRETIAMWFYPVCSLLAVIGTGIIAYMCVRDLFRMMREGR